MGGIAAALASWSRWEMSLLFARRPRGVEVHGNERRRDSTEMKFPMHSDSVEVHYGIACDGCGTRPVMGSCYRCSSCRNYDLCEVCHDRRASLHPEHTKFVKRPSPPTGAAAALGRHAGTLRQALLEMHYVHHGGF